MEDSRQPRKRRKSTMFADKKLLLGEKVEVKSIEEGFLGSWHAGKIIECAKGGRKVEYDNLLLDDETEPLTEYVKVPDIIDGISSETSDECWSRIRPIPPFKEPERESLCYGLCVDTYYNDAWWEGVVFDCKDCSDSRKIFFPDLGDEITSNVENLRRTHQWDEVTGEWKPRGNWLFLEIIKEYEKYMVIPISIKDIWYNVRQKEELAKIRDWASPLKPVWKKLILEVINHHLELTTDTLLSPYESSESQFENGESFGTQDFAITPTTASASQAVAAPVDIGLRDGEYEEALPVVNKWVANNEPVTNQVVPVQPKALSVICCNPNKLTGLSSPAGPKARSSGSKRKAARRKTRRIHNSDSDESSQDSGSKVKWVPRRAKLDHQAELRPESINEYLHSSRPGFEITRDVRNYLLSLGWEMDSKTNNGQIRVRYISPGGKMFHNIRAACESFKKSTSEKSSPTTDTEDAQYRNFSSPDNLGSFPLLKGPHMSHTKTRKRKSGRASATPDFGCLSVEPAYRPASVFSYLRLTKKNNRSNKLSGLLIKVRKHLAAIGWSFWSKVKKGRDEWRYDSPTTGKTYYSLRSACKAIATGKESNARNTSSSTSTEDMMCSDEPEDHSGDELPLPTIEAQRDSFSERSGKRRKLSRQRAMQIRKIHDKKNGEYDDCTNELEIDEEQRSIVLRTSFSKKRKVLGKATRVLRSRKRVRQAGPSTSSQVPRTVLSWLIDNNANLARTKVYYQRKSDVQPIKEGRITRDGIKCNCCRVVFPLSAFEAHAGSHCHRPAANLFLEDGRCLVECQMQMMRQNSKSFSREPLEQAKGNQPESWNDHICSICHYGGKLILCDQCPSSYHADCLNLQKIPEGDWFCPSCCCGICGESQFDVDTEKFTDKSLLCCHQCERQYHAQCIRNREMIKLDVCPTENWFCCKLCEKVHWGLQQLLGKPILVGHNNLTWTLIKPMNYEASNQDDCDMVAMAENYSKLNVALEVMHECFEPVKEPQTGRDLVEDVIFGRSSRLNRLNFKGFYTVLLERNDELITVAILRVYGNKVAEIPLVGTRFQHRRLGMCRILMNEIEKNLIKLGVDRLVLPAASSVLNTWTTSFGFSQVAQSERADFLGYTFLEFQDTVMCQKILRKRIPSPLSHLTRDMRAIQCEPRQNVEGGNGITMLDFEGNSGISEVYEEEQVEGNESVDQGTKLTGAEDKRNGGYNGDVGCPVPMVTDSTNQKSEPGGTPEVNDQKKVEREKCDGNLKFYKRKKAVELRPPIPRADYPKVEVSCR